MCCIFIFQSGTKQKIATWVLTTWGTEEEFCLFSCKSLPDPKVLISTCKPTVLGGSSVCDLRILFLTVALYRVLDETEIRWNTSNSLNRLPSYLDFGGFQSAVSCDLLGWHLWMCVCMAVVLSITDWKQQNQKLLAQLDAHMPLQTLSLGAYLGLSHWQDIFLPLSLKGDKWLLIHKIPFPVVCCTDFPCRGLTLDSSNSHYESSRPTALPWLVLDP